MIKIDATTLYHWRGEDCNFSIEYNGFFEYPFDQDTHAVYAVMSYRIGDNRVQEKLYVDLYR